MHNSPAPRFFSPFQEAIFAWFATGRGNAVVEAVAGSGKTTTLVEGFRRAPAGQKALFCCFNRAIATELQARVPAGVVAKTLHSVGFGAVMGAFRGCRVDDQKTQQHAAIVTGSEVPGLAHGVRQMRKAVASELCKVYGLIKGTLTDLTDTQQVEATFAAYGLELEYPTQVAELLPTLDATMREDTRRICFDEMLSFVVDHDLRLGQYDLVAVDEAQDLNLLQIEIVRRLIRPGGRMVAVGDSRQAIYLFRGSDSDALNRISAEFNVPTENRLPLSITYRCARAIVALAREIVPSIQHAPNAVEGQVIRSAGTLHAQDKVIAGLQPGTMVLCRANAPLAGFALQLIREGRKACIKGRDIGRSVAALLAKLTKIYGCDSVKCIIAGAQDHAMHQCEKLALSGKQAQADALQDRCDTLVAITQGAVDLQDVNARIERLFSDANTDGAVVFSSIHRSKGLEADTVCWLWPEVGSFLASKAKTLEAQMQESNLDYVAITRAKTTLIIQARPPREEAAA